MALRAAALLAVDPAGLGGAVLRGPATLARDAWLAALRALLPPGTPWRRMPPQVAEGRLLGGLDLAATLAAGRPVAERGLLAEASGGVLVVPMAERLAASATGPLAAALDTGEIVVERDGIAARTQARLAAVLLDEGLDDERAPAALRERVAFALNLDGLRVAPEMGAAAAPSTASAAEFTMAAQACHRTGPPPPSKTGEDKRGIADATSSPAKRGRGTMRSMVEGAATTQQIQAARARLPSIEAGEDVIEALAAASLAFGVGSLRIASFALRAAKAAAALAGRDAVAAEDAELAAALVIAPRATTLPAAEPEDEDAQDDAQDEPPSSPDDTPPESDAPADPAEAKPLADSVAEAARAAIPADLLAVLSASAAAPRQAAGGGRAGAAKQSAKRGRPAGVRRGMPRHGVRLAIVETLRAAAPWQRLRRQALSPSSLMVRAPQARLEPGGGPAVSPSGVPRGSSPPASPALTMRGLKHGPPPTPCPSPQGGGGFRPSDTASPSRILVRREDFRVGRFKERTETLTIFVVDASGSAALHRLAEVKGAIELILADCYVRRDSVALIAFRGERAELILPPTRSLARAKRALAGQPGGGGTPLAAAIDAAALLADSARRKGQAPLVVLLTDGKANIARTGLPGRAAAEADAQAAALAFRLGGAAGLVLDIAPRPGEAAARLARDMGARYIPLPYADAQLMSRAVLAAGPAA